MPSKGKPTFSQKKKKLLMKRQVNPDAYLSSDIRSRYIDSAKILELNGKWPESLAIRIFGPELMGSIAFALDDLAQFKNSFRKVSKPTRRVVKGTHEVATHSYVRRHTVHTRNYILVEDDDPPLTLIGETFVDESYEEFVYDPLTEFGIPDYFGGYPGKRFAVEFQADSTQKQRYEGQDFGTLERLKNVKGNWNSESYVVKGTQVDYEVSGLYGFGDIYFDRYVTTDTVEVIGSTCHPTEWIYFDTLELFNTKQMSLDIGQYHLSDFVVKSLANKRFFDGFYQLGELRDLPKLFRNIDDLLQLFRRIGQLKLTDLPIFDKRLADVYLGYLFGYKSLSDAVKDLMETPQRLAKHMNNILKQNNKVYTGRYGKKFTKAPSFMTFDPTLLYYQPFGFTTNEIVESKTFSYEVRCVINQTIAFPPVMEPKFLDKNYRDFVGLNPSVSDFYNLVPFTWLTDWFTGLGSYINMLERVVDDRLLINFGFMTVILSPELAFSQVGEVSDQTIVLHADGSSSISYSNVRPITFTGQFSYEYTHRMDIADLVGGEIGLGTVLRNLNDTQLKILGSLISKFS